MNSIFLFKLFSESQGCFMLGPRNERKRIKNSQVKMGSSEFLIICNHLLNHILYVSKLIPDLGIYIYGTENYLFLAILA